MTILEKQGPSTGSAKADSDIDDYPVDKEVHRDAEASLPPSYMESLAGSSQPVHDMNLPPASNFVAIHQRNSKISGTWAIDTSLQVPQALLKPLESGQTERTHLSLHTWNGTVSVGVALVSGSPQKASIDIYTSNGRVGFRMLSRVNAQPFKLKIVTRNGAVHVSLPRDFCGPLQYNTRNGKVKFSDELMKTIRIFTNSTSFVGDWQQVGFTDYKSWQGDEVDVETSNGKIWIGYEGDPEGGGMPQGYAHNHDAASHEKTHRGRRGGSSSPECAGESSSGPSKLKKGGGWWGRR